MKILIAEDDRVSALKLRRALEKLGYVVEVVCDGAAAWRRICEGGVQLLISDWMMPEIDGPELCRLVRARPDALYTYLILLTARTGRDDRLSGLEAGADDFLAKPLDNGELVARLNVARRILAMQEQLRAHAAQLAELHGTLERQNELLERQNALLSEKASTDGLTGLNNRRHFDDALSTAVSFATRHGQPLSLVLLDVDHFKAYNDDFGHPAGDEVLRSLAGLLRCAARSHDVVARYGGEEFAVILPATDANAARTVAERLRATIAASRWNRRSVTASFGVTTTSSTFRDPGRLIAEADQALYGSKSRGRDRVTHHLDLVHDASSALIAEHAAY